MIVNKANEFLRESAALARQAAELRQMARGFTKLADAIDRRLETLLLRSMRQNDSRPK